MEEISLTTPALLFSAISLIMLAYTNRFLAYAAVVRNLHAAIQKDSENKALHAQIMNLRKRLFLTQAMQILGIGSLLLCVLCMFLLYVSWIFAAEIIFGIALVLLIFSLALSIREIQISSKAHNIQLRNIANNEMSDFK